MRCDDGRVISNVICQAISGEDITVHGDGLQTRSFCYIDDMIEALCRLMASENAVGFPVNLGNPNELTVKRLVDLVIAMTDSRSRIVHRSLPEDDPRRRKPDIGRAIDLLRWRPRIALEAGLRKTIGWFEDERKRAAEPADFEDELIATAAE
jgi:UDP-glucuronate decarboxylase